MLYWDHPPYFRPHIISYMVPYQLWGSLRGMQREKDTEASVCIQNKNS